MAPPDGACSSLLCCTLDPSPTCLGSPPPATVLRWEGLSAQHCVKAESELARQGVGGMVQVLESLRMGTHGEDGNKAITVRGIFRGQHLILRAQSDFPSQNH